MKSVSFNISSVSGLVPNSTLSIYDTAFNMIHQELTDGLVINVQLEVGDYYCRVFSRTHSFGTSLISVTDQFANFSFNIQGVPNSSDVPSDARFCKVYGRVVGVDMNPAQGINISVSAENGYINEDDDLVTTFSNISTNSDGYVDFILRRGSSYVLTGLPYYDYSYDDLPSSILIHVPDKPTCKLIDVIAPIPEQINPVSIDVQNQSVVIEPDILMTDGTKLLKNMKNYIEIKSDTLTSISVNNTNITLSDVPFGTHEIAIYAKNFKSQVYESSNIVKRSGLPKLVGRITLIST